MLCDILDADANLLGASSQLDLNIRRAANFLVGVETPGTLEKELSSGDDHQPNTGENYTTFA